MRPAALLLAPAVFLLAGCATRSGDPRCPDDPVANSSHAGLDFRPFDGQPKGRLGSIPCPGPFTFFTTADPNQLGTHAYSGSGETERGIIYTLHGGFIDIAHVRKAADWTAYHHLRFKLALSEGWQCLILPSKEGSVYRVKLTYPAAWRTLPETSRRKAIDDLSIRLAQRLAITQTEWHEIATWFGYSSTTYPEKPSALTYDDMPSHVLGANIAGMALRQNPADFNAGMTYYLKRELDRLGAVTPEQTLRALGMVEGKWWKNGFVVRRMLDIGEGDGVIEPWIVPGYPDGGTAAAVPFVMPTLTYTAGIGFRLEIEPHMKAWSLMRRVLPGNPDRCEPEKHFPLLMRYIRQQESNP